ncbi:MAG: hypothetical protein ACKOSS_04580, partial [Planctomycetia bacterium]
APGNFTAVASTVGTVLVGFDAPNSGSVVDHYEYSTDGGKTWVLFDNPSQGPGTNIAITVDSYGNPFVSGQSYGIFVRVISEFGAVRADPVLVTMP